MVIKTSASILFISYLCRGTFLILSIFALIAFLKRKTTFRCTSKTKLVFLHDFMCTYGGIFCINNICWDVDINFVLCSLILAIQFFLQAPKKTRADMVEYQIYFYRLCTLVLILHHLFLTQYTLCVTRCFTMCITMCYIHYITMLQCVLHMSRHPPPADRC